MLIVKKFEYVLPGRIHNNPIEHHFGLTRGIVGSNRHLDCPSFLYAQQRFTIKHLHTYCRNKDGSHNREKYQKIFNEIKEVATELKEERKQMMLQKFTYLTTWNTNLELQFIKCENICYISGYVVRKLWENHNKKQYITCYNLTISNRDDVTYNARLINDKQKGGLFYPAKNIVILAGLCVDVVNSIIENEEKLQMFKEATTNSIVCLSVLKAIMIKRIKSYYQINSLLTICPLYNYNRCKTIVRHCLNTMFNISCDRLSRYLNRLNAINTITLSIVK